MEIDVRRIGDLAAEDLSAWRRLLDEGPCTVSPFVTPRFAELVDRCRGGVRVGVLADAGRTVGFFPYQLRGERHAVPVGWPMSDMQAVVVAPGYDWCPRAALASCGLTTWEFDHLLMTGGVRPDIAFAVEPSPYIDLSGGFEAYRRARREAGSKKLKQIGRKARKMEREVGPLTFTLNDRDPEAFAKLAEWKSGKFRQTGVFDLFEWEWVPRLLRAVLDESSDELTGWLSTLRCEGRLVAADLGMRTGPTLASWFTGYDTSLHEHGPGHILSVRVAEAAAAAGVTRIDLGKGPEDYKWSFTDRFDEVAEGAVDLRPFATELRRGFDGVTRKLKRSAWADRVRQPVRRLKAIRRSWERLPGTDLSSPGVG
ncbi:MAG: GNAT family N-acetyltransferase [Planctomycetota bacterium]